MTDKKDYTCSFCSKAKDDVKTLIAGPNQYICDECVDLCYDIIHESRITKVGEDHDGDLPRPDEIKEFLDAGLV